MKVALLLFLLGIHYTSAMERPHGSDSTKILARLRLERSSHSPIGERLRAVQENRLPQIARNAGCRELIQGYILFRYDNGTFKRLADLYQDDISHIQDADKSDLVNENCVVMNHCRVEKDGNVSKVKGAIILGTTDPDVAHKLAFSLLKESRTLRP